MVTGTTLCYLMVGEVAQLIYAHTLRERLVEKPDKLIDTGSGADGLAWPLREERSFSTRGGWLRHHTSDKFAGRYHTQACYRDDSSLLYTLGRSSSE